MIVTALAIVGVVTLALLASLAIWLIYPSGRPCSLCGRRSVHFHRRSDVR